MYYTFQLVYYTLGSNYTSLASVQERAAFLEKDKDTAPVAS